MADCSPAAPVPAPCNFVDGQCYVCLTEGQPFLDDPGQDFADLHGADVGCAPCADLPNEWMNPRDRIDGKRFLAPDDQSLLRRDARGEVGDTMTNEPRPMPRLMRFRRAACWTQEVNPDGSWFGRECFGENCDCSPPPRTITNQAEPGGEPCDGGATPGEIVPGIYPDCFGYQGTGGANTQANNLFVRRVENNTADVFSLTSDPDTLVTMFSRSGDRTHRPCTSDLLSQGMSKAYTNSVCGAALNNNDFWWTENAGGERPDEPFYTFDAGIRSVFDRIDTDWDIRIGIPEDFPVLQQAHPLVDVPTVKARNKVLARMSTTFPGENDSLFDFTRAENASTVDHSEFYGRSYRSPFQEDCDAAIGTDAEVQGVFGTCYLRRGTIINGVTGKLDRQPVRAHMVITSIAVKMEVVMHRVFPSNLGESAPANTQEAVYPHIGIRVVMEVAIRAFIDTPEGGRINRPWYGLSDPLRLTPVEIINGDCLDPSSRPQGQPPWVDTNAKPKVVRPDGTIVDDVIYYDPEGNVIEPFHSVEWRGSMNTFSDPPTFDVMDTDKVLFWGVPGAGQQSDGYGLLGFAHAFEASIGGLPSTVDSFPSARSQMYAGSVSLSFRQGLCDFAGVGCP